jgi:predicted glycogen debranching enzyme
MQPVVMIPAPGERFVRFVGDQLSFRLGLADGRPLPPGWKARLRTNIGRGQVLREEIIQAHTGQIRLAGASWRDVPMVYRDGSWSLSFSLTEVGFFKSKAYAIDPEGRQHWPEGPDAGVSVHPDSYRTFNTIYCAFPRMFGESKSKVTTVNDKLEHLLSTLDKDGFTVIPESGTLRDLIKELPHIIDTLGCRILHLLPVNPTPTTYARFGRFGSPYAVQDLLAIDPALIEFDKKTTGIDQFRELTYATHARGGRVFLDVVINHTGWGSTLQENHPEWYVQGKDKEFVSPGAWGVVWEDLVELDHSNPALWEYLAGVFLEWCRRGVDGFRCDAGYKIPVPAWRYITARVQEEFPETIFLLEGLGGSWEATENLLTEGAMQWCYSELFQNHSRQEVRGYLDYALKQSARTGLYVHYSETHDNNRLAQLGRTWSLLRNRLCALTSINGAFGFTCGVEWLAPEKIQVHQSRALAWGNENNIVSELAALTKLLANHPCFFDNATLTCLSGPDDDVFVLRRVSAEGTDEVLALINTDAKKRHPFLLSQLTFEDMGSPRIDLLGQPVPKPKMAGEGKIVFELEAGQCFCLAATAQPRGLSGERYREWRAQSAWAITTISQRIHVRDISSFDWRKMAEFVRRGPALFLSAVSRLDPVLVRQDVIAALESAVSEDAYPPVILWHPDARSRVTIVPESHWLLLEDEAPFRVALKFAGSTSPRHVRSVVVEGRHVACYPPGDLAGLAELTLERYGAGEPRVTASLRFEALGRASDPLAPSGRKNGITLLTNGRGGMARMGINFGSIQSKYDCLLGANLHPAVPVDRHVLAKRARLWLNADGFVTPLNAECLVDFQAGPPARWRFVANAGDGRAVEVVVTADMLDERNTTILRFERPAGAVPLGKDLDPGCDVSLVARVEIEDRNFHSETHHNGGTDYHFIQHTRTLKDGTGFEFAPCLDRQLRVLADSGRYHEQPEWSFRIAHPIEATRGQADHGDAFSPGWFELPLAKGGQTTLVVTADRMDPAPDVRGAFEHTRQEINDRALQRAGLPADDAFGRALALSVCAFVAKREQGKTVIAGYPWFLDWGRDSLIAARGMIAAGMVDEVRQLLTIFGRFEENGTLPNTIHGEDASNRDTSDAPLWFGIVCQELAATLTPDDADAFYSTVVDTRGRTLADILKWIAAGYRDGTPNGIRMDPVSGLIWSPSHFTWMDTNYPAATPRQGYPIEIQVLWICLLRQVAALSGETVSEPWSGLAEKAEASFQRLFWLEKQGWYSDVLLCESGVPAESATPDTALRSNCLFAISLGLVNAARARRCVQAAMQHLVVPGALRSLAPLPVSPPLVVVDRDGRPLNDPARPYFGRYEGDEDTRRKPAYHNGTAWTWTFPTFCEALALAWQNQSGAVQAARAYLYSMNELLQEGCVGHLPEIVDGDAPHVQRGCDAQAWSTTEALRVWKALSKLP